MVSQKFMVILYQQPDYANASTSSSSSSPGSSDEQNPLQTVKEENDDNLTVTPSTSNNFIVDSGMLEPLTIIKEENEDVKREENKDSTIKEEEEDNSNDLHLFDPEFRKIYMNKRVLPSDEAAKDDDQRNFSSPCMSPPYLIKDKDGLRPPSKRVRREKVIFDPSEATNYMQRNYSKKIPFEIKDNISSISEISKPCNETPKEVTSKCKEPKDGDLQCEYCGKYMHRIDYLRLHLMKHTGEAPYKCPYCTNAYRARWRLNQHVRTHTRNLPYHCPYCCYRGNRSDYLTSHINRIHKNLLRNDGGKVTKRETTKDSEGSEVNAIKEEKLSEGEIDTVIKEEEEFPLTYFSPQNTQKTFDG